MKNHHPKILAIAPWPRRINGASSFRTVRGGVDVRWFRDSQEKRKFSGMGVLFHQCRAPTRELAKGAVAAILVRHSQPPTTHRPKFSNSSSRHCSTRLAARLAFAARFGQAPNDDQSWNSPARDRLAPLLQSGATSSPRSGNSNCGAFKVVLLVDVALLMTFKVFLNLTSTINRLGSGVLDMANPIQLFGHWRMPRIWRTHTVVNEGLTPSHVHSRRLPERIRIRCNDDEPFKVSWLLREYC